MATPRQSPSEDDMLSEAVSDLSARIETLVYAVDEVREQLHWISTNGIPPYVPSTGHGVLTQMAANPMAADWGERLVVNRAGADSRQQSRSDPELAALHDVYEHLQFAFGTIATEQLELMLSALAQAEKELKRIVSGENEHPELPFPDDVAPGAEQSQPVTSTADDSVQSKTFQPENRGPPPSQPGDGTLF